MQIAELMAMSNSEKMPPTDLRPYYLKDLDLGKRVDTVQKPVPASNKTSVAGKNKKHK